MDSSILRTLENSGLNTKEARIYGALLELGRGNVTTIAKQAELKRSNLYQLLDGLEEKGFVSQSTEDNVRRYVPTDPTHLLHGLEEKSTVFRDMLPVIRALYNQPGHKPLVQYFEGQQAAKTVYRDINRHPEAFLISSVEKLKSVMPEEVIYWQTGLQRGTIRYRGKYLLPRTKTDLEFARHVHRPPPA